MLYPARAFLMNTGPVLAVICALFSPPATAEPQGSFENFINRFETKAVNAGFSRQFYRDLTEGMTPDPTMPNLVASQPEFVTPIWEYIGQRVSEGRIAHGKSAFERNRPAFDRNTARFGVDPYVLAAIWGMESDFGAVLNNQRLIKPIIRSLMTLVYYNRDRVADDEFELINAMQLIRDFGWTNETLVGSWAGAIGHLQIIASGVVAHQTDGDGDGRVDVHNSLPDALATASTFLLALGYEPGLDWGYEVEVPDGFDYMIATRNEMKRAGFFTGQGVTRVHGRQFTDLEQPVFLYVPAGVNGPKFLMTPNYLVLKAYNFSDSYALSMAHLTDRLKGAGPFASAWPLGTRFPNREERVFIQQRLNDLGFYDGEIDGRIGPISQESYQRFQNSIGLLPDGFITADAVDLLRSAQ